MEPLEKYLKILEQIDSSEINGSFIRRERRKTFGRKEKFPDDYNLVTIARSQQLIIDKIQGIQNTLDIGTYNQLQDHKKILDYCSRTEALLKKSQEENLQLQLILSKTYPVQRMALIMVGTVLASSLSLLATIFLKVSVVHPVLAVIGIISSSLFLGMAHWRKNHAW